MKIFFIFLALGICGVGMTQESSPKVLSASQYRYSPLLSPEAPQFKKEQEKLKASYGEGVKLSSLRSNEVFLIQEIYFQNRTRPVIRMSKDEGKSWEVVSENPFTPPSETIPSGSISSESQSMGAPIAFAVTSLLGMGNSSASPQSQDYRRHKVEEGYFQVSNSHTQAYQRAKAFHQFLKTHSFANNEEAQKRFLEENKITPRDYELKRLEKDYQMWFKERKILQSMDREHLTPEVLLAYDLLSSEKFMPEKSIIEKLDETKASIALISPTSSCPN